MSNFAEPSSSTEWEMHWAFWILERCKAGRIEESRVSMHFQKILEQYVTRGEHVTNALKGSGCRRRIHLTH
jgi:hypothetical protein